MVEAIKASASVSLGVDHDAYRHSVSPLRPPERQALGADLD
jgi:hypothetical protein